MSNIESRTSAVKPEQGCPAVRQTAAGGWEGLPEVSDRGRDFLLSLHSILEAVLPDFDGPSATSASAPAARRNVAATTGEPQQSFA